MPAGGIEVTRYPKMTRSLAGVLALIVGLTLVASPAFAAPLQTPARPLAAAAAAKVEAMPAATLAQAAQATPAAATGDKPFFKSTKGVLVLVLMATGITWAAVSRSQDAVHSPGRN
jgi:hypothetical protein